MHTKIADLEKEITRLEIIRKKLLADIYVCKLETQALLSIIDTLNSDINACLNRGKEY